MIFKRSLFRKQVGQQCDGEIQDLDYIGSAR